MSHIIALFIAVSLQTDHRQSEKNRRRRRMEGSNKSEIESELDKICKDIKGKASTDNAVGILNRVKILFDRIFSKIPKKEKRATVRNDVRWFNSETKQLKIMCRKYGKKWLKKKQKKAGS